MLFDVFGSFDEPNAAEYVISVFDSEDLSDLFGDGYSSPCDNFCKEGNVFFLDLYRQLTASGKWLRTR